jgi:hypothetical protein
MNRVYVLAIPFLLASAVAVATPSAAGAVTNPPHIHAMPCPPSLQPDRIRVTWTFDSVNGFHKTGARTLTSAKNVHNFYGVMCAQALVTYSHKVVRSCPAPASSGIYHLNFLLGTHSLLRVTETIEGCETLYVDKRPDLGIAYVAILPQGIPRPPLPDF